MKRVGVFAWALCLVLGFLVRQSFADVDSCSVHNGSGETFQETNNWCWAAGMEFLFLEFGKTGYSQSVIVEKSCYSDCGSSDKDNVYCWQCEHCITLDLCDEHHYYLDQLAGVLYNAHFREADGGIPTFGTVESLDAVENDFCWGNHLYAYTYPPEGMTKAHMIVMYCVIREPGQPDATIRYLDPNSGQGFKRATFEALVDGWVVALGPWGFYAKIGMNLGPETGVEDIRSFTAEAEVPDVKLVFEIQAYSSCMEDAGVYISDNTSGPYRLIGDLVDEPLIDVPNTWYDDGRFPASDDYYYFLGYECSLGETSEREGLFAASWDFPVSYTYGSGRPSMDPPGVPLATDVPQDFGRSLNVTWELSDDDGSIDRYHIYREIHAAGGVLVEGRHLVASVPPGTSSYVDGDVASLYKFSYWVSSAHHGSYTIQEGDGNLAIWNDFSDESVEVEPIDNFHSGSLLLSYGDTLRTCPAGDEDTLKVLFTVIGSDGSPTADIPADSMSLVVYDDNTIMCTSNVLTALRDTDENGTTEFEYSKIGGCGVISFAAKVRDKFITDLIPVVIRSPDIDGDGNVGLPDLAVFATTYPPESYCGDPNYNPCADFDLNCTINLVDLALFSAHFMDVCGE